MQNAVIVSTLKAAFDRTMGLFRQFIEVCPDELRNKKFGGWPLWQQIAHTFSVMDFFVLDQGAAPSPAPWSSDVTRLMICAEEKVSKAQISAFMDTMEAVAQKYITTLDDAKLAEEHQGLSARFGASATHAMALHLLSSHAMYHLGSLDAALRENGLKGVF